MRMKVIAVLVIAFLAYAFGTRAVRVSQNPPETVRQQAERLWRDPKARKSRKKAAAAAKKKARKAGAKLAKKASAVAKDARKRS